MPSRSTASVARLSCSSSLAISDRGDLWCGLLLFLLISDLSAVYTTLYYKSIVVLWNLKTVLSLVMFVASNLTLPFRISADNCAIGNEDPSPS